MRNRSGIKKLKRRWLIYAALGLVLMGFGLCCIAESAHLKYSLEPSYIWVLAGTLSLVVFSAGASFFGEAVVCRVRYLVLRDQE